jgi:hypothetical protein
MLALEHKNIFILKFLKERMNDSGNHGINEKELITSYKFQRDQFKDNKRRLLLEIENLREQDEEGNRVQISRLEEEIQSIRPTTSNGREICHHCDCTSLKYEGKKCSFIFRKERLIYACEICGRKQKY